ncbi:peptidoglycan-binding domain-containing protein [Shimia sp. Alg240-R146]|uniref:peptidoglycan-binding domain-containing protein n=1 Tax=Shimia sp. Alg240-R146 TaxID=2993449 RepID=UPI0022E6F2D4|nr:hypothetical protein [Shimia sp. Alg240-R146]
MKQLFTWIFISLFIPAGASFAQPVRGVECLQRQLLRSGYKPVPIDGLLGARTVGSFSEYNERNALGIKRIFTPHMGDA